MRVRAALICTAAALSVLPSGIFTATASSTDRQVSVSYSVGSTEQAVAGYEDRVTVSAKDAVSSVVALTVQVTEPDGTTSRATGCNSVVAALVPQSTVTVTTSTSRCSASQIGVATRGTISFAFHEKPRPKPASHVASVGNRFAVLIGIQDYAGNTHSTIGADGDLVAIRAALLKSGWAPSHILTVRGTAASADGIRKATDWLVTHSSPKTFSLLHYSGHVCIASRGPCASGHTYLWGQDNRFVSEDEFADRLSRLQGHAWLDVAGCESGAFDNGFHSSTHLFTSSSRASETSYEYPDRKQSVWVAQTWVDGYSKGMADHYGRAYRATMLQMASYGVRNSTQQTSKQKTPQHPVSAGGAAAWTLSAPPGL